MGVPKKLTEMQRKFAHLLVTNEGRKLLKEIKKELKRKDKIKC